jgi:ribosome-associated protein
MDAESIRSEIAFRFSRSSGPGGQHAQKSSTRGEALFEGEESQALTAAEK